MKILLSLFSLSLWSQVIILDPGHGGDELGAIAKLKNDTQMQTLYEKDLTLKFAKILKKKLNSKYQVYLTRSFDKTLSLQQRADMADKMKADLFISLHFNSSSKDEFSGFETYYLDNRKNRAISKVEEIENQGLRGEELVVNQILIDLAIKQTTKASKKLGQAVHGHISKELAGYQLRDRGLKPGLFYVLALSKRPGLLIEGAFVSNKNDLLLVSSESFLERYSDAIAKGIDQYFAH